MKKKLYFLSQFKGNQGSGVGDYCALLSANLNNKKFISTEILSWGSTKPNWSKILEPKVKGEIISIHFVPYSFGRWGLFLEFFVELYKFRKQWNIHIMFHEIWIGDFVGASIKDKIIGKIQKFLVIKMIHKIKPFDIHTTNISYLKLLKKAGIHANYLPMFGTIPIFNSSNESFSIKKQKNTVKVVLFGCCHMNWPWDFAIDQLCNFKAFTKNDIEIHAIGKLGKNWQTIKKQFLLRLSLPIFESGFLPFDELSLKLHDMDLSIISTPLNIIGKSSSAATLLEHGIPAIAHNNENASNSKNWIPKYYKNQIYLLENYPFEDFIKNGIPLKNSPRSGLEDTAKIFMESIKDYL